MRVRVRLLGGLESLHGAGWKEKRSSQEVERAPRSTGGGAGRRGGGTNLSLRDGSPWNHRGTVTGSHQEHDGTTHAYLAHGCGANGERGAATCQERARRHGGCAITYVTHGAAVWLDCLGKRSLFLRGNL